MVPTRWHIASAGLVEWSESLHDRALWTEILNLCEMKGGLLFPTAAAPLVPHPMGLFRTDRICFLSISSRVANPFVS